MNRLRVQLILAFTLVVLVAVGAIAVLIIRTTNTEFRQYVTHSGMQASGSGLEQLVAYYEQQGSWDGVESVLAQVVFFGGPGGMPLTDPLHPDRPGQLDVMLADASGKIVYDSAGLAQGRRLKASEKSQALAITETIDDASSTASTSATGGASEDGASSENGAVIGYLLLSYPSGPGPLGQLEQQFLNHMQQILLAGAALAVAVGLSLGVFLSRSLTAPLQRLAAAARAVAGAAASGSDLTQRVHKEGCAEMVEVAQAFNEMTTALGESERQRQMMVADVAHELRTPLTVMQGNLRAILDGVYPLEKGEISRVYDETRLLGRLVDDLRELALADAGQLRLCPRPTDVAQLIHSTVENLAAAAEAHEVTLTAQAGDHLPGVQADSDRVAQVLRNLIINALRYTPPGGSVAVTAQRTGSASPAGEAVEIAVADTGQGIAPQDLPHIFERFWRADPARARSGGTGLGLSIAQSLVEAQGGHIWVESVVGQGSTFRFTLPVVPA